MIVKIIIAKSKTAKGEVAKNQISKKNPPTAEIKEFFSC
jgi:hypothetical protein